LPNSHFFVLGCERSGTTPLVRLLAAHPSVALGMERYKYILRDMRKNHDPDLLTLEHFERERFLDFRPTDTNLIPPNFGEFYRRIEWRFDHGTITMAGDKILPPDTFTTLAVADAFPDARFIFIFRDLLRVASSFDVRAQDPDDQAWPARNDHEVAYRHWVESFEATDALVDKIGCERVFVVRPRKLYARDAKACAAMFAFLGLEVTPEVATAFADLSGKWHNRQEKALVIDAAVQRSLLERIDQSQLRRYQRRVEIQAAPTTGWAGPWHRRRLARSNQTFGHGAGKRNVMVLARRRQLREERAAAAKSAETPTAEAAEAD
jgi:hypothetical protein